jgi:hypothetical protein
MPTLIAVRCPHCQSDQIVKRSKTSRGNQRYLCQNKACTTGSFLLDYRNRGRLSKVKEPVDVLPALNIPSGFMQRAPQLCGASPPCFVSDLRIDAARADCGARPPTPTLCAHVPIHDPKSDASLGAL